MYGKHFGKHGPRSAVLIVRESAVSVPWGLTSFVTGIQSRFQAWHDWPTRRQGSASEKQPMRKRIGAVFLLIQTVFLHSVWSWYSQLRNNVTHF